MPAKRLAARWFVALVGASALAGAVVGAPLKPQFGDWGFDAPGMDGSVKPGDDFFKYANGTWDAHTDIPADRSGYGVDYVMADAAELHVRGILEVDPVAGGPDAAEARKSTPPTAPSWTRRRRRRWARRRSRRTSPPSAPPATAPRSPR